MPPKGCLKGLLGLSAVYSIPRFLRLAVSPIYVFDHSYSPFLPETITVVGEAFSLPDWSKNRGVVRPIILPVHTGMYCHAGPSQVAPPSSVASDTDQDDLDAASIISSIGSVELVSASAEDGSYSNETPSPIFAMRGHASEALLARDLLSLAGSGGNGTYRFPGGDRH